MELESEQAVTAQGGGAVELGSPEALHSLPEAGMVMGWTIHDQRATH